MIQRGVVLGRSTGDDVETDDALATGAVGTTLDEQIRLTEALAAAERARPEDWVPASDVLRR